MVVDEDRPLTTATTSCPTTAPIACRKTPGNAPELVSSSSALGSHWACRILRSDF